MEQSPGGLFDQQLQQSIAEVNLNRDTTEQATRNVLASIPYEKPLRDMALQARGLTAVAAQPVMNRIPYVRNLKAQNILDPSFDENSTVSFQDMVTEAARIDPSLGGGLLLKSLGYVRQPDTELFAEAKATSNITQEPVEVVAARMRRERSGTEQELISRYSSAIEKVKSAAGMTTQPAAQPAAQAKAPPSYNYVPEPVSETAKARSNTIVRNGETIKLKSVLTGHHQGPRSPEEAAFEKDMLRLKFKLRTDVTGNTPDNPINESDLKDNQAMLELIDEMLESKDLTTFLVLNPDMPEKFRAWVQGAARASGLAKPPKVK
jgi:hypothetical protein